MGDVQTFRVHYFRESLLEQAEEVRLGNVIEAVEKASGKPPQLRVDVWSDKGRVAEIRAAHLHPHLGWLTDKLPTLRS